MSVTDSQHHDIQRRDRLVAMGEMATSLAHELRNPLGSMELFCSLLQKDLADQPALLNMADQIHHSIKALDRIISNCLQFARDVVPSRRMIEDPTEYLKKVLAMLAPKLESAEVSCEVVAGDGKGGVYVDSYLMQQAILNLVINAQDAVLQRRETEEVSCPHIQVTSHVGGDGEWRVGVIDRGIGIRGEDLSRIFDPFYTTKQTGTGLGLAIVHSIVNAHGGRLEIESSYGVGTKVWVIIPRQVEKD